MILAQTIRETVSTQQVGLSLDIQIVSHFVTFLPLTLEFLACDAYMEMRCMFFCLSATRVDQSKNG